VQLLLRQGAVDLLHVDQLLDLHDLTRDVGRDGVEDGRHALLETQGLEHAVRLLGQADGGAEKGDAEVAHLGLFVLVVV